MSKLNLLLKLGGIAFLGLVGLLLYQWASAKFSSEYNARQCEKHLRRDLDPYALQSWATNLLVANTLGGTNEPASFKVPPQLVRAWKYGPPRVSLREATSNEEAYVYIFWGSGVLGHWGLSVGSPTFVPMIPQDGSRVWKPGIYFWEDFR